MLDIHFTSPEPCQHTTLLITDVPNWDITQFIIGSVTEVSAVNEI